MASSDLDVVLRRSGRKRNAEWRDTMELSIRASRSKGTSDTIPVSSRGGRPSHKKKKLKMSQEVQTQVQTEMTAVSLTVVTVDTNT